MHKVYVEKCAAHAPSNTDALLWLFFGGKNTDSAACMKEYAYSWNIVELLLCTCTCNVIVLLHIKCVVAIIVQSQ